MIAAFASLWSGFVIADVRPAIIAIVRNAPLIVSRLGSPKLMLDAPHVVLTPSSSRSLRTRWKT